MKLGKKIWKIMVLIIFCSSAVYSDGQLSIKGLHTGMTYEQGCEVVSKWQIEAYSYKVWKDKCGFIASNNCRIWVWFNDGSGSGGHVQCSDKNGYSMEEPLYKDGNGVLSSIKISSFFVNQLFGVKNMTLDEFAQSFINSYQWIDGLEGMEKYDENYKVKAKWYTHRSPANGWEITIGNKNSMWEYKDIVIEFFEPVRANFD